MGRSRTRFEIKLNHISVQLLMKFSLLNLISSHWFSLVSSIFAFPSSTKSWFESAMHKEKSSIHNLINLSNYLFFESRKLFLLWEQLLFWLNRSIAYEKFLRNLNCNSESSKHSKSCKSQQTKLDTKTVNYLEHNRGYNMLVTSPEYHRWK